MLEEKKKSNILIFLIKVLIVLWTIYLLTFLILDEIYKDKINCKDKDQDNCDEIWYNDFFLHPFNFKLKSLDSMIGGIGGYINIGFILIILILSSIVTIQYNLPITIPYKYTYFLLIAGICLIYHIIHYIMKT
tara:strand:- start:2369 stop:2767 length:399 start_codon:yes stop_codon:yes gene_type:complete